MKPSTSHHNKALREARKAKGLTEVRVWLEPDRLDALSQLMDGLRLSRQDAISAAIWVAYVGMQR